MKGEEGEVEGAGWKEEKGVAEGKADRAWAPSTVARAAEASWLWSALKPCEMMLSSCATRKPVTKWSG